MDNSNDYINEYISPYSVTMIVPYVPQKKNIKKIIICLLPVFTVLVIFTLYIMFFKSDKHNKQISHNLRKEEQIEKTEQKEEKIKEEIPKIYPQKIEKAHDKVSNLYFQDKKDVYLTFYDVPSKEVKLTLLELLKTENVKATFFVIGQQAQKEPEIIKKIYDDGHYIANHSYTHDYKQIYVNKDKVYEEYLQCERVLKDILGEEYNSYLFRFPGGSWGGYYHKIKQEAKALMISKDIAIVNWNVLTGDAAGHNTIETQLQEFQNTMDWNKTNIVLQHDTKYKIHTVEVTKKMIELLKNNGYEFKNFYDIFKK